MNKPIGYIPDTGLKTLQDGGWCVANAVKMGDSDIPLYTQQRPHNTVLVPCDKLAEMQAELDRLKALCISYIDDEWSGTSSYQEKIDEVKNERK